MKLKTYSVYFLFVFALIAEFSATAQSQVGKNSANINVDAKRLRDLYFRRDYEGCADSGRNLTEKSAVEAQAWLISCRARIAEERENSLKAAQNLTAQHSENAWSWFALANAQTANQKNKDALAAAEKAQSIEPDNEEFMFLKAQITSSLRGYDEAAIYLEKNSAKIKDQARKVYMQALAIYNRSRLSVDKIDEPSRKQSFEYFARAVSLNPQSVSANFLYGAYLDIDKRYAEAAPLLKKAVALSPRSFEIRKEYWKNLENQPGKTDAQKSSEIAADADAFLRAGKNSPDALMFVAQKFKDLKNKERQEFYENQILQKYPNTKYDENIAYARISDYEMDAARKTDPAKLMEMLNKMASGNPAEMMNDKEFADYRKQLGESQNKLKAMRWDYLKRPQHFDENKLGNVYFSLLSQIRFDKDVSDSQFDDVLQNVLKYKKDDATNVNAEIAKLLIGVDKSHPKSIYKDDAVKFGRAGITEADEKIVELSKKTLSKEAIDFRAKRFKSDARNALAMALLNEKKFDEAEKTLLEAEAIDDANLITDFNLAALYLEKKDYARVEKYYLKDATGKDSDKRKFRELYRQQHGSFDGFDEYFAGIKEKIYLKARESVLASRISNSKEAAPFSLKTIDDKTVSFSDLKGKIVVINVWGTWCAPCVIEMPQLQQLYKKYENDKDVAVITMDTNDELDAVKKFIADKKYEFPVLLGDSYTQNIMINGGIAFPTTLFIDKQGKVSFIKVGRTENLLEEFGWRIEALKENK